MITINPMGIISLIFGPWLLIWASNTVLGTTLVWSWQTYWAITVAALIINGYMPSK